jgi:hypothetical protein
VITISLLLMLVAFILFVLSAIGVPGGRVNLVAAGLACWSLSLLVGHIYLSAH